MVILNETVTANQASTQGTRENKPSSDLTGVALTYKFGTLQREQWLHFVE